MPLLDHLNADIAVIQECSRPSAESEQCLWFGDNPRQGIAVVTTRDFELTRLPNLLDVPRYMFPVRVRGPLIFNLLAVWSKGGQPHPYIEGVVEGVAAFRNLLSTEPTILVGDLNSNVIWDRTHPVTHNHSALVRALADLGLSSCYHYYFSEAQGAETRPTHYFHWKQGRGFHIDYCFVPDDWLGRLTSVEVGSFESWSKHSDHRPLVVHIEDQ